MPPESGFGCAEIGNSCNEPTVDLVTNATAEATYTAVSIYCKYIAFSQIDWVLLEGSMPSL